MEFVRANEVGVGPRKQPRTKTNMPARKCPNPLFERWLTEWRDEAASKHLKTKYVYDKALRSLRKYPLRLASGREAIILDFFGQKICDMLDRKLANHIEVISNDSTDRIVLKGSSEVIAALSQSSTSSTKMSTRSNEAKMSKAYVPVPRTGPYALLMAMHNAGDFIKKNELIEAAQPMCDKSFIVPDHGSYYTAWSSMATLVKKGLACREGNPARYIITDIGQDLVMQMLSSERNINETAGGSHCFLPPRAQPKLITLGDAAVNMEVTSVLSKPFVSFSPPSSLNDEDASNSCPSIEQEFRLLPGEFDVVLCVDNCETVGGIHNERKLMVQSELRKNGINFDVRKLHVGDFLWIAREKVSVMPGRLQLPKARELVLDYIVERKRKDDLASSIIDGRFHEQKHRLRSCNLKHPVYLVEEYGSKNHLPLPDTALLQAITNTQVMDGFTIKVTKDLAESVAYLTLMTRYLQTIHGSKTLCSRGPSASQDSAISLVTFDDFNQSSMKVKPISVTELFVKQLVQASGISTERAVAIAHCYATPAALFVSYSGCETEAKKNAMLASIQHGSAKRNLGLVASKLLSQLYTTQKLC